MSAPLLATKWFVPPAQKGLVVRARLLEKLDAGLRPGCRLTLVSAPAGFGKTTLVSTWLAGIKSPEQPSPPSIAWLSLDDGDNAPIIFWSYIISSLQTQQEGVGKLAQSLLQGTNPPDLEGILASLVNDLAQIPHAFILILDDFHLVRNPAIHRSLSFFIEHLPPQFHVMIASRTDPPLPLALLRGRGQLLEIRLAELRFSNEEAAAYLNQGMKLGLSLQAVDTLNTKTEGWAAGLQMAALSMQGRPDSSQFVQTFSGSNRYILEYLLEEVLNRQPEDVKEFLLHTSILERLCASLCEAVIGESDSLIPYPLSPGFLSPVPSSCQEMIEFLERSNLFLIPMDEEKLWYRYHHLFAEILRAKLAQSDPALASVLQRRAAGWFEENGMLEEAFFYTHAAKDNDGLVRLIEQNAGPMIQKGQLTTPIKWVQLLPEDLVLNRPWLCMLFAWAYVLKADTEKAISLLDRADELIRKEGPNKNTSDLPGTIFALRTEVLESRGDIPGTIEMAHQALMLLDPANIATRAGVNYSLGRAYYESGDLVHADQVWSEFVRMSLKAGVYGIYAVVIGIRSTILAIQGKLQEAINIYQQTIN